VDRVLWLQGFCHPAGLLPASKPQVKVLAPSVFTEWTTRRLTLKELLDCWDIPESAMKKFSQLPIEPSQFAKLPFIGVTPAKVLYGVLICLLPWLNPECQVGQSVAAQHISDAPHPTQSLPQVLSSFPGQVLDGSTSLRGEISTRQRAAKDDDAAIPFHLWDEPFWLFFTVLGRTTAFISETSRLCSTKRQTPILEVLRSFILWVVNAYIASLSAPSGSGRVARNSYSGDGPPLFAVGLAMDTRFTFQVNSHNTDADNRWNPTLLLESK